jgi:hypothetical protein
MAYDSESEIKTAAYISSWVFLFVKHLSGPNRTFLYVYPVNIHKTIIINKKIYNLIILQIQILLVNTHSNKDIEKIIANRKDGEFSTFFISTVTQ